MVPRKLELQLGVLPDADFLEHLARIQDATWIEGLFHRLHGAHLGWTVLEPQEGGLGQANAVLAGESATERDDTAENLRQRSFRAYVLGGVARQQIHMDVAVAGMAEVDDGNRMLVRDRAQRGTKRESFDQTTLGSATSTASDDSEAWVPAPTDKYSDIQMTDRRKPGLKQMLETML